MTQEQIDSIRERMCDEYCMIPSIDKLTQEIVDKICGTLCPLNELEAEPKIGRWERYKYGWACSNCRCDPMGMTDYLQSKEELYHYCPNCGAKMEVSE